MHTSPRRAVRPAIEGLEPRALMATMLLPASLRGLYGGSSGFDPLNGRTLFTQAENGTLFLWGTDGAPGGTSRITPLRPANGATAVSISHIIPLNGVGVFQVATDDNAYTPWVTNGTAGGTHALPGPANSTPTEMVVLGGKAYFLSMPLPSEPDRRESLWATDGTAGGTARIYEFGPSRRTSFGGSPFAYGDRLFFDEDSPEGFELWSSDGTTAGTSLLKNLNTASPLVTGKIDSSPSAFAELNGKLLFRASEEDGLFLWSSDGTADGTVPIADFQVKSFGEGGVAVKSAANVFMSVPDSNAGTASLWVSDGTPQGTHLLKAGLPIDEQPKSLGNGLIVFRVNSNTPTHQDLWISDGSEAHPLPTPTQFTDPFVQFAAGGTAYFRAATPGNGDQLWKTDGRTAALVDDIRPGPLGGKPYALGVIGGRVVYSGDSGKNYDLYIEGGNSTPGMSSKTKPLALKLNSARGSIRSLQVTFKGAISAASFDASAVTLVTAGTDGVFGTSDDVQVAVQSASAQRKGGSITVVPRGPLAFTGRAQLRIVGLTDSKGNMVAGGNLVANLVRRGKSYAAAGFGARG